MLVEELLELDKIIQRVGLILFQSSLNAEIQFRIQIGVNVEKNLQHIVDDVLLERKDFLEPDTLKKIEKPHYFFTMFHGLLSLTFTHE